MRSRATSNSAATSSPQRWTTDQAVQVLAWLLDKHI